MGKKGSADKRFLSLPLASKTYVTQEYRTSIARAPSDTHTMQLYQPRQKRGASEVNGLSYASPFDIRSSSIALAVEWQHA
jgi:hypothetical protein